MNLQRFKNLFYYQLIQTFGHLTNCYCRRCVSVCLWPLTRRFSRGVCDHSQTLWSLTVSVLSERVISIHPPAPPRLSPDALLRRLDSLALSCVSLILGHARALRTRVRLSLVLALSLSLVGGRSLVSGQRSLSRLVARLSLARRATRLVSCLTSFAFSPSRVSSPSNKMLISL